MPTQYRLPCDCGESVVIETGQAGGSVACQCGATLDVPTLRGIKQLPVYEPEEDLKSDASAGGWSAMRGMAFAGGLLMLVVCAPLAGYFYYQASGLDTEAGDWSRSVEANESIDAAETFHLWDVWKDYKEFGLGPKIQPPHIANQETVARYNLITTGAGIAAGIGFVLLLGAIAIPRAKA